MMKLLRKLFEFIWAIWGMFVVIHSLIIVTPIYFILFISLSKKAGKSAHTLSRIWAWYLMFLFGIRVHIHNKERLNRNAAYVFISNHNSQLDIPVCALTTQHFFKFLAKEELTKIPLLGYIIARLYITVKRGSTTDKIRSLEKMKKNLEEGTSVWIFPEGTRNTTEEYVSKFQDGAFHLAVQGNVPVAMCTLVSTRKILPTGGGFYFRPGVLHCYWSEPFTLVKGDNIKEISVQVRTQMMEIYKDGLER